MHGTATTQPQCRAYRKLARDGAELLQAPLIYVIPYQICETVRIPFMQWVLVLQHQAGKPDKYGMITLARSMPPQSSSTSNSQLEHTMLLEECAKAVAHRLQMSSEDRGRIEYAGYYVLPYTTQTTVCLFLDVSKTELAATAAFRTHHHQGGFQWVVADEIINYHASRGIPISTKTVHLFTKRIEWCMLHSGTTGKLLETPSVVFAVVPETRKKWTTIFGQKVSAETQLCGKHYAFTDWEGALAEKEEQQREQGNQVVHIVRFLLFTGSTFYLEKEEDKSGCNETVFQRYDSVFQARSIEGKTKYLVQERWRQIPIGIV